MGFQVKMSHLFHLYYLAWSAWCFNQSESRERWRFTCCGENQQTRWNRRAARVVMIFCPNAIPQASLTLPAVSQARCKLPWFLNGAATSFQESKLSWMDFEHPCFINKTQNDDTWSADYDVVVDQQLKYDFHYTSAREGWLTDGQCYESGCMHHWCSKLQA